jgi:DNA-binding response OmpR family regulator
MNIRGSLINILLIEDDPGDARFIEEILKESSTNRFKLIHEKWLDEGIKCCANGEFDILLLDLMLPESRGIDTLFRITRHIIDIPIVVLTGLTDELTGIKAINNGAQDYLVKGEINSVLLVRSIRYAIERHRLLKKLKKTWQQEREEQERQTQHYLAITQEKEPSAGNVFTGHDEEILKQMVPEYRDVILSYIRSIRIREDRPSDKVRTFAAKLAENHVQAKDIIRIHLHVLNEFFSQLPSEKEGRIFSNDARLVLVELMGNILDIYHLKFLTTVDNCRIKM